MDLDLIYNLWFHEIKLPGSFKIELINEGINACELWNYNVQDYMKIGIDLIRAEEIVKLKNKGKYEKICEYLEKDKIEFIMYNDALYPEVLRYIPNPPTGLFVKGAIPELKDAMAVIGARKASEYGRTAAYKFAYELASREITIISGMARGIDSCAHKGCLDAKGKTIAVMGSGFKNIYPKENVGLLKEIVCSGCVITEFMPDEMPLPAYFPMRNRILSGLSRFVLVVEAGDRSGSLITAALALEQGRDVFAVPGNIFSPNSVGTNKLIRDGAKIIIGIQDILEEYGEVFKQNTAENLGEIEGRVIELLRNGAISLEHLLEELQFGAEGVLAALSKLECIGMIRRVYGNYYIIT